MVYHIALYTPPDEFLATFMIHHAAPTPPDIVEWAGNRYVWKEFEEDKDACRVVHKYRRASEYYLQGIAPVVGDEDGQENNTE